MNIENLRRLINAELLNKPSVSSVVDFAFEAKFVKLGYAFIGLNTTLDEISLAVKNGAYAVIIEEDFDVIDNEVAFIKVDSLSTALMRLIRFESSYKNLKFFLINDVQKAILQRTSLSKDATLLQGDIRELFMQVIKAENANIFFTNEPKILSKIAPLYETVCTDTDAVCIGSGSIFSTSVVCDEIYFQGLNFPQVFVGYLCGLLKFLTANNIKFKLGDLRNLGHFEPIFVNKFFNIVPFGNSSMVFITESNDELFDMETAFLKRKFKNLQICTTKQNKTADTTFIFDDLTELKNLENFHYALVKCTKTELENMLNSTQVEQKGLFD